MTVAILVAIGVVISIFIYLMKKGIISADKKLKEEEKQAKRDQKEDRREERKENSP